MPKKVSKFKKHPLVKKIIKNKKFQKYEKWFLVIFWAGAIFYLSNQSLVQLFVEADIWDYLLRKQAHMFEFGVLCFLIFRILKQTETRHIYWNIWWAAVFAVLYAISDEFHQYNVPGRHGVYTDVIIDTIGILISAWLIYLHYHYSKIKPVDKDK